VGRCGRQGQAYMCVCVCVLSYEKVPCHFHVLSSSVIVPAVQPFLSFKLILSPPIIIVLFNPLLTLSSTTGGRSDRRVNEERRCAERRRKYQRWENLARAVSSGVLPPDRVVIAWIFWFMCIQDSTS
jgi:hypothetical protein